MAGKRRFIKMPFSLARLSFKEPVHYALGSIWPLKQTLQHASMCRDVQCKLLLKQTHTTHLQAINRTLIAIKVLKGSCFYLNSYKTYVTVWKQKVGQHESVKLLECKEQSRKVIRHFHRSDHFGRPLHFRLDSFHFGPAFNKVSF